MSSTAEDPIRLPDLVLHHSFLEPLLCQPHTVSLGLGVWRVRFNPPAVISAAQYTALGTLGGVLRHVDRLAESEHQVVVLTIEVSTELPRYEPASEQLRPPQTSYPTLLALGTLLRGFSRAAEQFEGSAKGAELVADWAELLADHYRVRHAAEDQAGWSSLARVWRERAEGYASATLARKERAITMKVIESEAKLPGARLFVCEEQLGPAGMVVVAVNVKVEDGRAFCASCSTPYHCRHTEAVLARLTPSSPPESR